MDFLAFIIFGMVLMTLVAPFVNIPFFGSSLTFMMVYIWGRRNEHVRMSFLGLFPFSAPYLPWVLFTFSLVLGNSATVDLIGIIVGHLYFYFDDIYPSVAEIRGWTPKRYLRVSTYFPPQEEEIRVDTENLEQISGVNERPLDNIQPAPQTQEDINNENYNDTEEVTQQVQINDLQNVTSEQNRIEDSVDNTIIQDNQPQTEATESEVRDNSLDIDTVRSTQLGIENDNVESRENNIRHRRPFDSSSD